MRTDHLVERDVECVQIVEVGQRRQIKPVTGSMITIAPGMPSSSMSSVRRKNVNRHVVIVVDIRFVHAAVVADVEQRSDLRTDGGTGQEVQVVAEAEQVAGWRFKVDVHVAESRMHSNWSAGRSGPV